MVRRDVRFRPPALAMGPAVRWMLLRAFGPIGAGAASGGGLDDGGGDGFDGGGAGSDGGGAGSDRGGAGSAALAASEALALCRRFEVSSRVAARQGRARLAAELGAAAAEGFARDQ
ncbi:MAG: hypothetical protein JOZ15_10300, partial [Acidobacteria bacterium]|nr:hypothetical protein [Acidobacteriota bacterium]